MRTWPHQPHSVTRRRFRELLQLAAELSALPTTKVIGFLQIDSSVVVSGIRAQALEWLHEYGRVLNRIAEKELQQLTQLIKNSL